MILLKVADVMSKDIVTVKPGATIKVASDLMRKHDIGALPVVDISGNILGIITERDIVNKVVYKKAKPTDVKVEDIMTKEVAMAVPQMEIEDAARLMISRDIRRLPVIECEFNKPYLHQGKCVGIVTNVDALRAILETSKECKKEKKK